METGSVRRPVVVKEGRVETKQEVGLGLSLGQGFVCLFVFYMICFVELCALSRIMYNL